MSSIVLYKISVKKFKRLGSGRLFISKAINKIKEGVWFRPFLLNSNIFKNHWLQGILWFLVRGSRNVKI